MLYLASSIATSAVRISGRSAPSRSRRVLTFHFPIVRIVKNRGLTPARTCQDRPKLFVAAVAGRDVLGVSYINRP